jgi:hypothetical protein
MKTVIGTAQIKIVAHIPDDADPNEVFNEMNYSFTTTTPGAVVKDTDWIETEFTDEDGIPLEN